MAVVNKTKSPVDDFKKIKKEAITKIKTKKEIEQVKKDK
jgi:hypothetical protein